MNGALRDPRPSRRLLFSITIVNTVPAHRGCAVAAAGSTRQAASVLPVLLGVQPAVASEPRMPISVCSFMPTENLVSDGVSGKHKLRAQRADPAREFLVRWNREESINQ